MAGEGALMRAGSWQAQGEAVLLKTASDVFAQLQATQQAKAHPRVAEVAAVAEAGKTNSVDSSSTAAGRSGAHHGLLVDSATAGLLPPLRQISLDILAATEMIHSKALAGPPERNSIFQDVFNELAAKDELAPLQAGQLYTLPSMQFLENMLSDFDSRSGSNSGGAGAGSGGSNGGAGLAGPLDLAGDAFDLPDFHHSTHHASHHGHPAHLAHHQQQPGLRPTPFDQQQAAHAQLLHAQQAYGGGGLPLAGGASYSFVPMGGSAPAQLAPMPAGSSASGSVTLQASMRTHSAYVAGHQGMVPLPADEAALGRRLAVLQQQQAAALAVQQPAAHQAHAPGVRQPAVPQPAQPRATPRRQSHSSAYADFEYEEAEVSLQTSKSGRVRKVASFTGVKRKLDVTSQPNGSDSRDSRGSMGADTSAGEVGSKSKGARKGAGGGAKNRKGRRTICLNCGCHQTPQWRCGPLGPRTLCNACGVRYKKDLPLNCWPIRDGMMLPPGAVLPPGFVVPPGITIHTQPAEQE